MTIEREYYESRIVARAVAARRAENMLHVSDFTAQLQAGKGWVPVIFITVGEDYNTPEGIEIRNPAKSTGRDSSPIKAQAPKPSAGSPIAPTAPKKGATARVWEIAGTMPTASRADIIAACVADGIHPATAATQYSKWKKSL